MKRKAEENQNIPQKYYVWVPGVIQTYTTAYSNQQGLSYAIHQAFETRNEFFFNGKRYIGELGRDQLIADLLQDPGFFDMVQPLPGQPSRPVEIPLPMQPKTPQTPQAALNESLKALGIQIKAALVPERPGCDGSGPHTPTGPLKMLPTGGGGNLILCQADWAKEQLYRQERNEELGEDAKYSLTPWSEGKIYSNASLKQADLEPEKSIDELLEDLKSRWEEGEAQFTRLTEDVKKRLGETDVDSLVIHANLFKIHKSQIESFVRRAEDQYDLSGEDTDALFHLLHKQAALDFNQSSKASRTPLDTQASVKKAEKEPQPYMSWFPGDIVDDEVEYKMGEALGEQERIFEKDEEINALWEASQHNEDAFRQFIHTEGLEDRLEELIREDTYKDDDLFTWRWDDLKEDLTNLMEEINPDGNQWKASVEGFGWRNLSGSREFSANTGEEMLQAVLLDTENHFKLYRDGRKITIQNYHHDSPMGETYYIQPYTEQPENEQLLEELALWKEKAEQETNPGEKKIIWERIRGIEQELDRLEGEMSPELPLDTQTSYRFKGLKLPQSAVDRHAEYARNPDIQSDQAAGKAERTRMKAVDAKKSDIQKRLKNSTSQKMAIGGPLGDFDRDPTSPTAEANLKGFDQTWLRIGTNIELARINDPRVAQEIAMDRLAEDPSYYRKLGVNLKAAEKAPVVGGGSPWGRIDHVRELAPGIVMVVTPGHGGMWLSSDRLAQMPASLLRGSKHYRPEDGPQWFEEDVEVHRPFLAFYDELASHFGNYPKEKVEDALRRYYPEVLKSYEEETNFPYLPGLEASHKTADMQPELSGMPPSSMEFVDAETKRPWKVAIFHEGELYEKYGPIVRFWDMENKGPRFPEGQFVSSYYYRTLMESPGYGLDLMGHEPAWKISGQTMEEIRSWLEQQIEIAPPSPGLEASLKLKNTRAAGDAYMAKITGAAYLDQDGEWRWKRDDTPIDSQASEREVWLKRRGYAQKEPMRGEGAADDRIAVVESVDGRWMVLIDGFQAGSGPYDMSGASGQTWATEEEAWQAAREMMRREGAAAPKEGLFVKETNPDDSDEKEDLTPFPPIKKGGESDNPPQEESLKGLFDLGFPMEGMEPCDICKMTGKTGGEVCGKCGGAGAVHKKAASRYLKAESLSEHLQEDISYFETGIDHHKEVVQSLKDELASAGDNQELKEFLERQIKDNEEDIENMEKEITEREGGTSKEAAKRCPECAHMTDGAGMCTEEGCECECSKWLSEPELEKEAADTATEQAFERRKEIIRHLQTMDANDPVAQDLQAEYASLQELADQYVMQNPPFAG